MEDSEEKPRAAQTSRDRLTLITESARLGWWDWNIETGELVWSKECLEIFGLLPDTKMSYERFLEAIYPEDRERVDQAVQATLKTGHEYNSEMRVVWPDGTMHWLDSRGRAYFDKSGRAIRMSGAAMDVTQFKETEENLKRARAEAKKQADNFAAVFDAMPAAAFFSNDRKCEEMISNRAAYELLRMPYGSNTSKSAPSGQRPPFRIFEKGRELNATELPVQQAAATGRPVHGKELEIRFEDGSSIYEYGHAVPLFDEAGEVRGAVGAFLDVTDRKVVEERLRLSNERFQIALRNTPITVFNQGLDLRYRWMYNPASGYDVAEILGKRDTEFLERPEDAARMESIKSEVIRTGRIFRGEVEIQHQGVMRTYHVTIEPQRDPHYNIVGITCASFDLTDRKREEAEREKLGRQRQLSLDAAKMAWWHFDKAQEETHWDDTFKEIFGITADSMSREELIKRVHPDDAPHALANFEAAMNPADPQPYVSEYRILRPDGGVRWVETYGAAEFEGEGEARRAVSVSGTVRDITHRKAAEEALMYSHWRSRQLVESNIIPIVRANREGIIEANDAFLDLVGSTQAELEKGEVSWVRITPEEYLARDYAAIEEIEQRGFCSPYEKEIIRKDGRRVPILNGAAMVNESPLEWQCFVVDLTEQKRAQAELETAKRLLEVRVEQRTRELQQRTYEATIASEGLRELSTRLLLIQDEERRRIARELHDSAGQMLTALGLELASIREQCRKVAPNLARQTESVEGLVQQLHSEIRTTSYLLHPPLLEEAGLLSALSWYARGLTERSGIEVHLDMPQGFGRLPRDTELIVFRLVQESLTNIHRHSGSKTATIRLTRTDQAVTVEVKDEGKGMPSARLAAIRSGGSGVGIRGMRERLHQLRGELRIASSEAGTQVLATIPIPQSALEEESGIRPIQAAI